MSIDRLSALPDPILSHILSFLEMKEAATTSMLSKRWEFLWKNDCPRLVFLETSSDFEEICEFVARVHRTLVMCSTNNLDRFVVDFRYHSDFECDVNVWIDFAVRNKVKNVHFRLVNDDYFGKYHMLPQMIYSHSSLTSLLIHGCILAPRGKIEWQSLTELHIEEMKLGDQVIEKIFSGCPVLKSLYLERCWGFNRLKINSASVYKLVIYSGLANEDENNESFLEISAPFLKHLRIRWYPLETEVLLTNMASLVRANVGFISSYMDVCEDLLTMMKELYESIAHVKELVLDEHWLTALSTLMRWRLPPSKQVCLKVKSLYDNEKNTVEIMGLLESSPNLETLSLTIRTHGYLFKKSTACRPPARDDLDCDLLHLKTVKLTHFGKPNPDSGLLLNLSRILLKRATVLEKMVIVLNYEDLSAVVMISQSLLAFPRSSMKAQVVLRRKN